jgi:hypothetical protein
MMVVRRIRAVPGPRKLVDHSAVPPGATSPVWATVTAPVFDWSSMANLATELPVLVTVP